MNCRLHEGWKRKSLYKYLLIMAFLLSVAVCTFACQSEVEKNLNEAVKYYEKEQIVEAIGTLEKTQGKEPADAKFFIRRAKLYADIGNFDAARVDYKEAVLLEPSAELYTELGKLCHFDFEKGLNYFDQAIRIDSEYAEAYVWRGKEYQTWAYYADTRDEATERLHQAVTDITRAIELVPDKQYQAARALVYLDLELYNEALEDYSECIRQKQKASYYYGRAKVYISINQLSLALDDLDKAISLEPGSDVYFSRGFVYVLMGNYPQAVSDFNQNIELMPEHDAAYILRSFCYLESGNMDSAVADYRKALQLNPHLQDREEYFITAYYASENIRIRISTINESIKELNILIRDNADVID